ncbi:PREDICTED: uncharacterized protein LOC108566793 [Nicrophorus vespilloides]|uniref:Uncharacterized protein LOC108566793 n=1 Tax=Nicrophorus vespilloides TaxID=110193 RepID=A0ABM1N696_NICVS|nr:PREDICTED: uncharacterized protein LOC108566793 [Nicrophorus vespilloides]
MTQDVEEFVRTFCADNLSASNKENCTKIIQRCSTIAEDKLRVYIEALQKELLKPKIKITDSIEDLLIKLHGELAPAHPCLNVFLLRSTNNDIEQIKYNFAVLQIVLCSDNQKVDNIFESILNKTDTEMVSRAIKCNRQNDKDNVSYQFLHTWVIPQIFAENTTDKKRSDLIDLVMGCPIGYSYSFMSPKECKEFKNRIVNTYLKTLDPTRTKYEDWWKQCKVLIHYSGQILHNDSEITNAILRVIEVGFKTKNSKDRCGSYECWKELTNNYSIDTKCLRKHVKLLTKPLKAKISRQISVCIKRFEAYANLIEKLENYSISTIEDFLEFTFGPLSAETVTPEDTATVNPIKGIREVEQKSTEIFLKFLGHEKETCKCKNKTINLTDIYKVHTLINSDNVSSHIEIFVASLRMCTDMTWHWTKDDETETVINCLWWSMFKILLQTTREQTTTCLKTICPHVQIMIQKCLTLDTYFDDVLKTVLSTMLYYLESTNCIDEVQEHLILPIIKEISTVRNKTGKIPECIFTDYLKNMLQFCNWTNVKFLTDLIDFVETLKSQTFFNSEIISYALNQLEKISCSKDYPTLLKDELELFKRLYLICFDWIILNEANNLAHYFNVDLIGKLDVKRKMLSTMMTYQKKNPLLNKHILNQSLLLVKTISSEDEAFMNTLLELIAICISDPLLVVDKCNVLDYVKYLEDLRCRLNFDLGDNFLNCIESLLKPHKIYDILSILKDAAVNWNVKQKQKFSTKLQSILMDLTTHSDRTVSDTALSVVSRINVQENKTKQVKPSTRSTKVTAASSPLRLLGQEVESPIKLRGSFLDVIKKPESPRPVNQMPNFKKKENNLNDLSGKDFVVFDSEVKVSKAKMSEHQAEKFMKRRDDIPALYQDLSQSLSHLSDINPKENTNAPVESTDTSIPRENAEKVTEDKAKIDEAKNTKAEEEEKIKLKTSRELGLLKMDIVGADKFLQMPKKRSIKRKTWGSEEIEGVSTSMKKRKSLAADPESTENDKNVNNESESNKINLKKSKSKVFEIKVDNSVVGKNQSPQTEVVLVEKKKRGRPSGKNKKLSLNTEESNSFNTSKEIEKPLVTRSSVSVKPVEQMQIEETETNKDDTSESNCKTTLMTKKHHESPETETSVIEEKSQKKVMEKLTVEVHSKPLASAEKKQNETKSLNITENPLTSKDVETTSTNVVDNAASSKVEKTETLSAEVETEIIITEKTPSPKATNDTSSKKEVSSDKVSSVPAVSPEILNNSDGSDIIPCTDETPARNVRVSLFSNKPANSSLADITLTLEENSVLDVANEDTQSVAGSFINTPVKLSNELTCSPINQETPSKNKALLSDTLDISPIQFEAAVKNVGDDDNLPTGTYLSDTDTYEDKMDMVEDDFLAGLKASSTRSSRLLNLVGSSSKARVPRPVTELARSANCLKSPKADRIRKMMENCSKSDLNMDEDCLKFNSNDVLKFEKVVPSPLAAPRLSILKRKQPDSMDSPDKGSPLAKRKRVNFPDPPTTCEKIYFKELPEKSAYRKMNKKKNPMWKPLGQMDDTNGSIQDMQNQIDSLGISPLPQSPPREETAEIQATEDPVADEDYDGVACDIEGVPIFENNTESESAPPAENGVLNMLSSICTVVRNTLTQKQNYELIEENIAAAAHTFDDAQRERLISLLQNCRRA